VQGTIVYNPDVEDTIIGTLLFNPELIEVVLEEGVRDTDFFDRVNQKIFDAIVRLWNEKGDILTFDLILEFLRREKIVPDLIEETKLLERYGGNYVTARETLAEYCKVLKKYTLKRELVRIAEEILSKDYKDPEELLDIILDKLFELSEKKDIAPYVSLSEILPEIRKQIEEFSQSKTFITGIPSGFPQLDEKTAGFHPGELIIVAGRPGMGKSSFGLTIAKNVALNENLPVGFFSLEMAKDQLALRLISFVSKIPLKKLRLGHINEEEKEILDDAIKLLSKAPIFIDDSASLTTTDLRIKAKRMKKEHDIQLLIVDYLQLVRGVRKYSSRQEEVAEVSRSLKSLAKELEIPVIALAQLSRQVEHRSDKRPQLADLRESGQIEQDADLILFLHRPDYYYRIKGKDVPPELKNKVEIIVAKQRQGETGVVEAMFVPELSLFVAKDPREDALDIVEEYETTEGEPPDLPDLMLDDDEDLGLL
jgi:replicative DNA helicase